MESTALAESIQLPASRDLAGLFQEEFTGKTGLAARWAAERVQGRRLDQGWKVPFDDGKDLRGSFSLRWDGEFQRFLACRLGASAGRSEYLGAILRSSAGRWVTRYSLKTSVPVRLQASPQESYGADETVPLGRSSAALIIDSFVIELAFELEHREG